MEYAARRAPAPALEGLLITFFANRSRLLWLMALILSCALAAAAAVPVRYAIESQVLVGMGSEYTYRPPAGGAATVSQSLDRDQTMHTESMIMASPDLHRATLRAVGVARLYPAIVQPAWYASAVASLRASLAAAATSAGLPLAGPRPPADPVERALETFEAGLKLDVPKTGSVITVTFRHKDAELGAEALNTLVALFIQRRADLYRDDQSGIVARQVELTRAAMDAAGTQLAAFKLAHQGGGFDTRRDIVLRRRGALESDRLEAQSLAAQLEARLDRLAAQLPLVPQEVTSGRDSDYEVRTAAARTALDQLRAQYAAAMVQYLSNNPAVTALRAQLAAREADLAEARRDRSDTSARMSQNPAWLSLQEDRLKSEANLAVAKTRLDQDNGHLAAISAEVAALDASEQELGQLTLQRALSEETYRSATKILEDRRVMDEVEAQRRPTIRVLQPAVAPIKPPPIRALIAAAGAALALFGLFGATLLAHAFGRTYWQAETMETDLGIAVIAVIHELPFGGKRDAGGLRLG